MSIFDTDTSITGEGGLYRGEITGNWSVNGNPNGGYLMALLASAMLRESDKKGTPIVTANYISRCVPGPAEIMTSSFAVSKQFSRHEGRLFQDGMEKIRALGTFCSEKSDCGIDRYESSAPDLPPADECVKFPSIPGYTLFDSLDVRIDPACAGWTRGEKGEVSENRAWFSFADGRQIDMLSLFLIIDSMPPAAFVTQGVTAWVPTIELSVNIRNIPLPGPLRCRLRTRFITCGLLEADGEVWDSGGRLAAISRQIAQFRKGGA